MVLARPERGDGPQGAGHTEERGDGPQGAGHTGALDDTYSSGAYSPDFPGGWISDDGKTMMMVSAACCNFSTSDPTGLIPKAGGYQAHWTPVRISLLQEGKSGSESGSDGGGDDAR